MASTIYLTNDQKLEIDATDCVSGYEGRRLSDP